MSNESPQKVRFKARLLEPISRFVADRDESREYLQHIRVEPRHGGGVYLIATDARALAVMLDKTGYAEDAMTFSVDNSLIKAAQKNSCGTFVINYLGDVWTYMGAVIPYKTGLKVEALDLCQQHSTNIGLVQRCWRTGFDNTYVNWRFIFTNIKKLESGTAVNLQPQFLAKFKGFFSAIVDYKPFQESMRIHLKRDRVYLTNSGNSTDEVEAIGCIMGMDIDNADVINTEWLEKPRVRSSSFSEAKK